MSNTRIIQPTAIWTPTGDKYATIFSLINFFDYNFDNGGGIVTYSLSGMESGGTTTLEDGTIVTLPESAVVYFTGNMNVPSDIVQQWGTSDDVIWDYVAGVLSLTFVQD